MVPSLTAILLFIASGVLCIVAAVVLVYTYLRGREWRDAEATILEASVESFSEAGAQRRYRAAFLLRYKSQYDLREALVRSSRVSARREVAEAVVLAHPVGSTVRIHFDPNAPSQVSTTVKRGLSAFTVPAAVALCAVALAVLGAAVQFAMQPPEW